MKTKVLIGVAAAAVVVGIPWSIFAANSAKQTNCIKSAALINDRSNSLETLKNTQKTKWLRQHRKYAQQLSYASQWLRPADLEQARKDLDDFSKARTAVYRELDSGKSRFDEFKTKPVACSNTDKTRLKAAITQARKDKAAITKLQRSVGDVVATRLQPDFKAIATKVHDAKRAKVKKSKPVAVPTPSQ